MAALEAPPGPDDAEAVVPAQTVDQQRIAIMQGTPISIYWPSHYPSGAGCTINHIRLGLLKQEFVQDRKERISHAPPLTCGRWFVKQYFSRGLVKTVGATDGIAPRDALADIHQPLSLIKALVVLGSSRSDLKRPAFGWVSRSVPEALAAQVRTLLDPRREARWDIAPDFAGKMFQY